MTRKIVLKKEKINTTRLSEIATVIQGQSPESKFYSESEGMPFLQGNRTFGNLYPTFDTFTKKITKIAQKGDVLISVRAPVGALNFAPTDLCIGRGLASIRAKNGNNNFIYYALKYNIHNLTRKGAATTFDSVNRDTINNLELIIPKKIEERYGVAKVLSDLDAKIELNNKINQELEAMAKTLYDYWFVQFDFPTPPSSTSGIVGKPYKSSGGKMVYNEELKREIPEGWEVKELGELGEFKNGVNYNPSNPGEIACPIINVRNISASSFFVQNEDLDIIYLSESDVRNYSVSEESIIIARSGIPGATRLISDIAKNTLYCGFAIQYELINLRNKIPIFFFLKSLEEHIKSGSGGTILKNVNQGILKALLICLPNNEELLIKFNRLIEPIFDKINNLKKQNQQLSSLRDWLLPMLMNGQVASRASATAK